MKHETVEERTAPLLGVLLAVISVGGLVEIVPLAVSTTTRRRRASRPTALELEGRDIYVREGCCQLPLADGASAAGRDRALWPLFAGRRVGLRPPFQFGSQAHRAPDLARVGTRYSDEWHRRHLNNPRDLVPESNMPAYPWLASHVVDASGTTAKMKALRMVGVPYTDEHDRRRRRRLQNRSEMDALVAFPGPRHRLGTWK